MCVNINEGCGTTSKTQKNSILCIFIKMQIFSKSGSKDQSFGNLLFTWSLEQNFVYNETFPRVFQYVIECKIFK